MVTNAIGVGYASATDEATGQMTVLAVLSIAVSEDVTTENSQGSPYGEPGPLLVYDTLTTEKTTTITVEIEQVDDRILEIFGWNRKRVNTTLTAPKPELITIAASVAVTGLLQDQEVFVTLLPTSSGPQISLTQVVSPGPPDPGEFVVEAGSITFNAADVGKAAQIRYFEDVTADIWGGQNPFAEFDDIEIYAQFTLTKGKVAFWAPKCKVSGGANITLAAAGDSVSTEVTASVDTERGFQDVFAIWKVTA